MHCGSPTYSHPRKECHVTGVLGVDSSPVPDSKVMGKLVCQFGFAPTNLDCAQKVLGRFGTLPSPCTCCVYFHFRTNGCIISAQTPLFLKRNTPQYSITLSFLYSLEGQLSICGVKTANRQYSRFTRACYNWKASLFPVFHKIRYRIRNRFKVWEVIRYIPSDTGTTCSEMKRTKRKIEITEAIN